MNSFQWFFAGVAFGAWLMALAHAGLSWLQNKDAARLERQLAEEEQEARLEAEMRARGRPPAPRGQPLSAPADGEYLENVIEMRARRDDS